MTTMTYAQSAANADDLVLALGGDGKEFVTVCSGVASSGQYLGVYDEVTFLTRDQRIELAKALLDGIVAGEEVDALL